MDCKSRITTSPNGNRRVVHCRACKVRRAVGDGEVFVCPSGRRIACGPGCQLKRTFAWWGLNDDGTCGCEEMAAKMDAWQDECWAHLEEIVDHLRGAAEKRGLPFIATAARIAIARAIEAAKAER